MIIIAEKENHNQAGQIIDHDAESAADRKVWLQEKLCVLHVYFLAIHDHNTSNCFRKP